MKRIKLSTLLVFTVLAVGCTPVDESVSTTTSAATESTVGSGPATTVPGGAGDDRSLELVNCDDANDDVVIVCEAYDLIREHYVDPVDDAALAEAAAMGLEMLDGTDSTELLVCAAPNDTFDEVCDRAVAVADTSTEAAEAMVAGLATYALDPNSAYFDPQALDLLDDEQQGEIEGIGALVSSEDQTIAGDDKQCAVVSETCEIVIVSTIEGSPADTAGLERDDEIVGVDGDSIRGRSVDEVTQVVRGPAGTDVVLSIERGEQVFDVTITRAAVLIPVVETEVIDDVGYLRLWHFTGAASSEFERGVVSLLGEGVDELVIDLRDNPGGFLTAAIDVTSIFKEDGDVVVTEGPDENMSYSVNGQAVVPEDMPVTIVVNRGSASASEVVSATLQEAGLATVVGEPTFGKNTVQQRFGLSNGGALKLTIARWLTPGGHDFGGTGVIPDLEIPVNGLDPAELVEAIGG